MSNYNRKLRMILPKLEESQRAIIPQGMALRHWQEGDETAWAAIMNSRDGIFVPGGWSITRVKEWFIEKEQFSSECCFFICDTETKECLPVATATAWRATGAFPPRQGYLHMVASLPEYRGRGLGRAVTVAALDFMANRGDVEVILDTDDFRIPAIRLYISLGFVPVYNIDCDNRNNWKEILQIIDRNKEHGT